MNPERKTGSDPVETTKSEVELNYGVNGGLFFSGVNHDAAMKAGIVSL